MKTVWQILAVAAMLALALFLRTYRLSESPPGLYADEALDGNDGLRAWRTGHFRIFYEVGGREGLMANLQGVALGLWGRPEVWVLRLPGAVLGTLAVLGLYLLGRRLLPGSGGLWAALFLATSLWQIIGSRLVTRAVAAPCFMIWTWYLLERLDARERWAALGAGCVWGLGFYTYPTFRITPLLFAPQLRRAGKAAIPLVAAALVVVAPLAVVAARDPATFSRRVNEVSLLNSPTPLQDVVRNATKVTGMFFFAGDENPRHNVPGAPMLFWPVGVLFLCGLWAAARGHRQLLWALPVTALPAVLANEGVPHGFRASLMAPPVFLIAGLGGNWVTEHIARRVPQLLAPATLVLVLGLTVQAYLSYFERWSRDPRVATAFDQFMIPFAHELRSLPRELPKYVIFTPERVNADGLPLGAQVLMFLTDTATPEQQAAMNLHCLTADQTNQIARGLVYVHFIESTER